MLNLHNLQMVKGWAKELWQPWATITIDRATSLKSLEVPGIDPGTSRMLSERSTIWATPPSADSMGYVIASFKICSVYQVGQHMKTAGSSRDSGWDNYGLRVTTAVLLILSLLSYLGKTQFNKWNYSVYYVICGSPWHCYKGFLSVGPYLA